MTIKTKNSSDVKNLCLTVRNNRSTKYLSFRLVELNSLGEDTNKLG